jgi:hypothetical protein
MSQPTTRQAAQPNSMRFTGASLARTRFLGSTRRSARSMPSTSKSAVTPKGRIPNSRLPRGCLWPVPTSIWHCRPASCRRPYLEGMEQQRLFKLPQRLLRPRRTCRLQCHAGVRNRVTLPLAFTNLRLDFRRFANFVLPKGRDGFGNRHRDPGSATVSTRNREDALQ